MNYFDNRQFAGYQQPGMQMNLPASILQANTYPQSENVSDRSGGHH